MTYRVLGPFDRYNYGDLLFPLILKAKLEAKEEESHYYGLVASDLSEHGAIKTGAISKFYDDLIVGDRVIIAGGESLCASWADLYSYINSLFDRIYGNRLAKALDRRMGVFSWFARAICSGRTEYPFAFSAIELKPGIAVSFNAVGGSALGNWSERRLARFVKKLADARNIGVRDPLTKAALNKCAPDLHIDLVPDSAILIERLFSGKLNFDNVRSKYRLPETYIFFQVGNEKYQDLSVIYQELNKISSETGLVVVLCAIGHALGHEDMKPLRAIYKKAESENKNNFILMSDVLNVFDLMCVIQNSSIYIGTSLHGVITSLSFGVPYVPFNKKITKVKEYLKVWGVGSLRTQCNENEIADYASKAVAIEKSSILSAVEVQKNIADDFINKLVG